MKSQIFKKNIPKEFLLNFLDKICLKNNNYYIINTISYNLSKYHSYLESFINDLKDYYHISKLNYINRTITYTRFLTIIRQISRHLNLTYKSSITYSKSNYNITYYLYFS
jgi:hypothetical protein